MAVATREPPVEVQLQPGDVSISELQKELHRKGSKKSHVGSLFKNTQYQHMVGSPDGIVGCECYGLGALKINYLMTCDSEQCKITWVHTSCLRITCIPKDK